MSKSITIRLTPASLVSLLAQLAELIAGRRDRVTVGAVSGDCELVITIGGDK